MKLKLPRLVPPAGAPLSARAILKAAVPSAREKSGFTEILRRQLGERHIHLVSSGRAALTLLLRAVQQLSNRREVVIPAYTCFSVPSAVVRAGLTIRLCDVDPKTLDLDQSALLRLDLEKILCIIPSSLYGMPADLVTFEKIARASGAFLVDDAAQCLGATVDKRACGTFGDAGFYSLGRGKNITAMGGGIVVAQREDLAGLIQKEVGKIPRPSSLNLLSATVSSLLYANMLQPSRYWLLDRMPFLGLGHSVFDPNFRITRLSTFQTHLASQLLPLIETYNRIRQANAFQLRSGIDGAEGIEIPQSVNGANPVYLRFPVLAKDGTQRTRLLEQLRGAGIGASASYPSSIADIPGIQSYLARDQQPCPQARSIASRILTLPTHPYVTSSDIETMVAIVRGERRGERRERRVEIRKWRA